MNRASRTALISLAALGALGVATLAHAHHQRHAYQLRRHRVPVLPAGAEPIRLLHLSDLHLLSSDRVRRAWVARLAELQPDLVINTGDNHADAQAWTAVVDALGPLLDVPGGFVWGSNDYFAPTFKNPARYLVADSSRHAEDDEQPDLPWQRLGEAFSARGWSDLNHHRAELEINGTRIELRGTDDAHHHRDDYSRVAGTPAAGTELTIGVTHAPYLRVLDAMAADRMDLILAGHTHGGQVCLPGGRALITNCDIEPARVKGLTRHRAGAVGTSVLHVSGGLGTSPMAPYRLFCPPEASLITLVSRDNRR